MKPLILILLASSSLILSGCVSQQKPIEVPVDFVKTIDSTSIMKSLNAIDEADSIDVKFKSGQSELSEKSITYLESFIEAYQPEMVAVMGTGGAEKYHALGQARSTTLVRFFYERGVDSIMLNYRPKSKGRRGVVWALTSDMIAEVRLNAPSLIIHGTIDNRALTLSAP